MRSKKSTIFKRINLSVAHWLESYLSGLEHIIIGSKIAPSLFDYAKRVAKIIVIAPPILSAITFFILFEIFRIHWMMSVLVAVLASVAVFFPLSLAFIVAIPMIAFSNRGAALEARFPLLVFYLGSYLAGGMPLSETIIEMQKHKEETKFDLELEYLRYGLFLGKPLDSLLREVARISPSVSFAQLADTLSGAAKSGMPALEAVKTVYERYKDAYRAYMERALNSLGAIFESYLALTILIPLLTGTAGALTAIMPGGLDIYTLIFFAIFVLVPLSSIATIVIADISVSRLRM